MSTTSTSCSIPKPFRCGQDLFSCKKFQQRSRQRQLQQKRRLQRLAHRERLDLVSRYNVLGYTSIVVGILMFTTLVTVLMLAKVSWETISARSMVLLSWGFGMGLGCSFVLIFAESSRNFRWATQIQAIDEELQEIDTISTEEDAELIDACLFFSEEDECDDDFSHYADDDVSISSSSDEDDMYHGEDEGDVNDPNVDGYNPKGGEQV